MSPFYMNCATAVKFFKLDMLTFFKYSEDFNIAS